MKIHQLLGGAAVAIVAAAASTAVQGGRDAVAGGHRLVDLTRGALRPVFSSGPVGRGATNYVLDYKVSNAVGRPVKPTLRFELRTETGRTYGDSYDAHTFRSATKLLGLKSEPSSTASIRAAELAADGSVAGLANFGAVDPNADDLEVRVYGLWDPVYRDRFGRTWTETRVLVLTYSRRGDEYDRQYDALRLVSAKETLDGEPVQLVTR
jgi:hypothetical protein